LGADDVLLSLLMELLLAQPWILVEIYRVKQTNDSNVNSARTIKIRVHCYAGHRADEEPRRFSIGERDIMIDHIIDRWLDPAHRYYKVRGDDGGIYILRQDVENNLWELTLYDSGAHRDTRLSST
jgi:hypothetical protein